MLNSTTVGINVHLNEVLRATQGKRGSESRKQGIEEEMLNALIKRVDKKNHLMINRQSYSKIDLYHFLK